MFISSLQVFFASSKMTNTKIIACEHFNQSHPQLPFYLVLVVFFGMGGEAVTLNNHITSKELNKFNEVSSDAQHVHSVKVTFSN